MQIIYPNYVFSPEILEAKGGADNAQMLVI